MRRVISLLWVLALAGCDKGETGYVQLRVQPANAAASLTLYLDGDRLDFSHSPTVTLRHKTGRLALTGVASTWAPAICTIVVRKDRISALTVVAAPNSTKCVCDIRAPDSEADVVVCA